MQGVVIMTMTMIMTMMMMILETMMQHSIIKLKGEAGLGLGFRVPRMIVVQAAIGAMTEVANFDT